MATLTTVYDFYLPVIGGDIDTWGGFHNDNFEKLDDLLSGVLPITPNLTEGAWKIGGVAVTPSAAELNVLNGIAAGLTAAELSVLDGFTGNTADLNIVSGAAAAGLTAAELLFLNGVTSAIQTQLDGKLGTNTELSAIAALSTLGLLVRTADDTWATRSITSTDNSVTITNPAGTAGDIDLSVEVADLPVVKFFSGTASDGAASIIVSGIDFATYVSHQIIIRRLRPNSDNVSLSVDFSEDGVSFPADTLTSLAFNAGIGNAAAEDGVYGVIDIMEGKGANLRWRYTLNSDSASNAVQGLSNNIIRSDDAYTNIAYMRIRFNTGTIDSGYVVGYGYKY